MNKKILILTTSDRPREYTEDIKHWLSIDLESQVEVVNLEDLRFEYDKQIKIFIGKQDIANFDAVYIKHWHSAEEHAFTVANYMRFNNKPVVPSEVFRIVPKTKFAETFYLSNNGLPVPRSIFIDQKTISQDDYEYIVSVLGLPFIFKAIDGKKGSDNYLIESQKQFSDVLSISKNTSFISQEFIDNNGDFRIINFGDELKIAIKRTRGEGTHLNNTSKGGDGELVPLIELEDELKDISLSAARILGRDIAGIDVVTSKEGKHYIFEVNYSPQITTGTYLEEKRKYISDYFSKLLS